MSLTMALIVLIASNACTAFLGFIFGRQARATVEIGEHMSTEEDVEESKPVEPPKKKRRVTPVHLISFGVVAIGLVVALLGFSVTRNQDRIIGCVAGYSNASSAAIKAGREAQNKVNDKLDTFMLAIAQAFSSAPEDARELILSSVQGYNKARADAKAAQSENPLPDPPEDACRELLD